MNSAEGHRSLHLKQQVITDNHLLRNCYAGKKNSVLWRSSSPTHTHAHIFVWTQEWKAHSKISWCISFRNGCYCHDLSSVVLRQKQHESGMYRIWFDHAICAVPLTSSHRNPACNYAASPKVSVWISICRISNLLIFLWRQVCDLTEVYCWIESSCVGIVNEGERHAAISFANGLWTRSKNLPELLNVWMSLNLLLVSQ